MQKVGGEDVDQHKPHQFRQVVWFAQVLEGAGSATRRELHMRSTVMWCDAVYIGESSRNLYTRGAEHVQKYSNKKDKSFMTEHQQQRHKSEPANFRFKVIDEILCWEKTYEAVTIRQETGEILNSKEEFHMLALWKVRREVARGFNIHPNLSKHMDKLTGRQTEPLNSLETSLSDEAQEAKHVF